MHILVGLKVLKGDLHALQKIVVPQLQYRNLLLYIIQIKT